jgi:hypothetical protein
MRRQHCLPLLLDVCRACTAGVPHDLGTTALETAAPALQQQPAALCSHDFWCPLLLQGQPAVQPAAAAPSA